MAWATMVPSPLGVWLIANPGLTPDQSSMVHLLKRQGRGLAPELAVRYEDLPESLRSLVLFFACTASPLSFSALLDLNAAFS